MSIKRSQYDGSGAFAVAWKARGETVAPGESLVLASINGLDDAINHITCALVADVSHAFRLYVVHYVNDKVAYKDGDMLYTGTGLVLDFSVKSERTDVVYKNESASEQTVDADVIAWAKERGWS